MGCATVKEQLESKIMMLKLERVDIRAEREERIKQLQELTGETIKRKPIPDYCVHEEEINNLHKQQKKEKKKNNRKKIEYKYSPKRSRRIKEESDNESEYQSSEDIEVDDDEENENSEVINTSKRYRY